MFPPLDWPAALRDTVHLVVAYLLALPVGWYRERESHSIGVRTFPLVAMASCGYVLLAAAPYMTSADSRSRVIQGLLAGLGFIGGGAIFRASDGVHGTATAASIFTTGVLGAAVAEDRYIFAAVLALVNLVSLRLLLPIKTKLDQEKPEGTDPVRKI